MHRYIIGQSGTGKSTALIHNMIDNLHQGEGFLFIDVHGDDADTLLSHVPEEMAGKVVLFDPTRALSPLNVLEDIVPERRAFCASAMLDTFKSVWGYSDLTTPNFDQSLFMALAALLDAPGSTLLSLHYFYYSYAYRARVLKTCTNQVIKDFWEDYETIPAKEQRDLIRSTVNKTGFIMADPLLRRTLGYPHSVFDIKDIMDSRGVLIARLPQGELGIQKSALLGSLLLSQFHVNALGRSNRSPFYIYLDECHHFAESTVVEMLSGIRKFGVSLTLAHQYLDQLSPRLRQSIFGNIKDKTVFQLGAEDTEKLRFTEFAPDAVMCRVSELPRYTARISYGGQVEDRAMDPLPNPQPEAIKDKIMSLNAMHRQKSQEKIDSQIAQFLRSLS